MWSYGGTDSHSPLLPPTLYLFLSLAPQLPVNALSSLYSFILVPFISTNDLYCVHIASFWTAGNKVCFLALSSHGYNSTWSLFGTRWTTCTCLSEGGDAPLLLTLGSKKDLKICLSNFLMWNKTAEIYCKPPIYSSKTLLVVWINLPVKLLIALSCDRELVTIIFIVPPLNLFLFSSSTLCVSAAEQTAEEDGDRSAIPNI